MALPPFKGSFLKIQRGRAHISELDRILTAYGTRISAIFEPLPDDPSHSRLTFSEPPPPEIALILGDAVHNFRAALDIMVCDIARLRGKSSDNLKFPFAKDAADYDVKLRGEIRRLGQDVTDALRELKPYKGGNIALRGLHDLDILDKHELVIPVMPCVWSRFDIASSVMDGLAARTPWAKFTKMHADPIRTLDTEGSILPSYVAEQIAPYTVQEEGPITVLFADNLPFARKHVIPTLESLAQLSFEIVQSFARQFWDGYSA